MDDGKEAMKALASMDAAMRPSMHLWRAPPAGVIEEAGGSSASARGEGGVEWMKALGATGKYPYEGKGSKAAEGGDQGEGCWIRDTVFAGAGHSVHNTRQEAFVAALNALALSGVAAPPEV